jgi:hypothetical protein
MPLRSLLHLILIKEGDGFGRRRWTMWTAS